MYSFNASLTVAFFVRWPPKRKASSRSSSPIGRLVGIPHPSPHKRRFARPIIRHARPPGGVAPPNPAPAPKVEPPGGNPRGGVSGGESPPPLPPLSASGGNVLVVL